MGKRSEDVRIAASCNLLKRHLSKDKSFFLREEKKNAEQRNAEIIEKKNAVKLIK